MKLPHATSCSLERQNHLKTLGVFFLTRKAEAALATEWNLSPVFPGIRAHEFGVSAKFFPHIRVSFELFLHVDLKTSQWSMNIF